MQHVHVLHMHNEYFVLTVQSAEALSLLSPYVV